MEEKITFFENENINDRKYANPKPRNIKEKSTILVLYFFLFIDIILIFSRLPWRFGGNPLNILHLSLINGWPIIIVSALTISSYIISYYANGVENKLKLFTNFLVKWFAYIILVSFASIILSYLATFAGIRGFFAGSFYYLFYSPILLIEIGIPVLLPLLVFLIFIYFANSLKKFILSNAILIFILFAVSFLIPIFSPIGYCTAGDRKCIKELALKKNNIGLCDYYNTGEGMNYCYSEIYEMIDNKDMCNSIKKTEIKTNCYCSLTGVCEKENGSFLFIHKLLDKWYKSNGSYANFVESSNVKQKLNDLVDQLKKEKNRKMEYSIVSADKNYVIKLRFNDSDSFYCRDSKDSIGAGIIGGSEKTVKIEGNNFKAKSYCSGDLFADIPLSTTQGVSNTCNELFKTCRDIETELWKYYKKNNKSFNNCLDDSDTKNSVDLIAKNMENAWNSKLDYRIYTKDENFYLKIKFNNYNICCYRGGGGGCDTKDDHRFNERTDCVGRLLD